MEKHTLNILASLEIGDTRGFAGYCGNQLLAYDVQSMGGDGVEKILLLGRSMQDEGNHWHRWVGQCYQASWS